jgi:putative mRNA 3-end processing factor
MEWRGSRAVVSGDYKRRPDPTCMPFEVETCDVFVTEATFALPVFRHPPEAGEIARLLRSVALFPERTHVIGCYALGKAQRLISLLREGGWDRPIPLHGALMKLCRLYEELGVPLGPLENATVADKAKFVGNIVLAPPSAIADRWARRLTDPVPCLASGWMRVRQRARSGRRGAGPMVISDHADCRSCSTPAPRCRRESWITMGGRSADPGAHRQRGRSGRAQLHLCGARARTTMSGHGQTGEAA